MNREIILHYSRYFILEMNIIVKHLKHSLCNDTYKPMEF